MRKLLALLLLSSSAFAQQQVQPVAGVLTLNLVPGTSSFKVILSANVTSVAIQNPTPGTIISVIFTENATGGFTVVFGGNIANPCSVTTTANATTTCQFQYDATSNTWNGIGGGGSGVPGPVFNVKDLKYGAFGDMQVANNVSISRTANTLTLPAGMLALAGQLIQCTSSAFTTEVVPYGPTNGGNTLPVLITGVTGQVVTYSANPVGAGGVLTDGFCYFGHNDTTAIKNAFAAALVATNGSTLFSQNVGTYTARVYIPSGGYMVSSTSFDASTQNQNIQGVSIIGDGPNSSIFYPVIGYTNTAPANCGWFICGFGWGQSYKDFGIELLMSGNSPLAFANEDLVKLSCGKCFVENLHIENWYNGGSAQYMINDSGGAELHYVRLENPLGGTTGAAAFLCSACSSDVYNPFFSNTFQNFQVSNVSGRGSGQYLNIHGGVIDEGAIPSVVASKSVALFGTILMGGVNCLSVDATSEVRMSGGYCGTFNGNAGGGGPTVASGGKLWMGDVEVSANGAGQSCYNSAAYGGIIDMGGNECILAGTATAYKAGSFVNQFALTHLPINGFQSGTLAAGTVQSVAVDQPLSVTSITWTPSNAFACTAGSFPTFSISDGTTTLTTAATDTATNGAVTHTFSQTAANLLNPGNVANTVLQLKVVTTGTCGTAPTNVNINVWGQASAPSF